MPKINHTARGGGVEFQSEFDELSANVMRYAVHKAMGVFESDKPLIVTLIAVANDMPETSTRRYRQSNPRENDGLIGRYYDLDLDEPVSDLTGFHAVVVYDSTNPKETPRLHEFKLKKYVTQDGTSTSEPDSRNFGNPLVGGKKKINNKKKINEEHTWTSTGRKVMQKDGRTRVLYRNPKFPGELRVRRMRKARDGRLSASYVRA